jgi:hypothetical protein
MSKSSWMMDPTRSREMPSCSAIDLAEIRRYFKISSWIWSVISGVVGLRTSQHLGSLRRSIPTFPKRKFCVNGLQMFCDPTVLFSLQNFNSIDVPGMTIQNGKNFSTLVLCILVVPIKCVSHFKNSALMIKFLSETKTKTMLYSSHFLEFSYVLAPLNVNIENTYVESSSADKIGSNLYRFLSPHMKFNKTTTLLFSIVYLLWIYFKILVRFL